MKSLEQHFADWESNVFGFGYGTGEGPVLGALKLFLAAIPRDTNYWHETAEQAVTAPVAWLLINILTHDDMLEYGTSPRAGWLTARGKVLAEFVGTHTVEELVKAAAGYSSDYIHCYPDHCNCDEGDCRPNNPFWKKR